MYNPKNLLIGQINKPSALSAEDARSLHDELGLIMPLEHFLSYLQYSKSKKHIQYEEIYLIDSLYEDNGVPAVKSFKTNDAFLGESYADILSKHRTMYGEDAPVTLPSLTYASDEFIEKYTGNVQSIHQSTCSSPLELHCLGLIDTSKLPLFTIDENNYFGLYNKKEREKLATLEKSYLFALVPDTNLSEDEYEKAALKAMSSLEGSGLIYNSFVIGKRGIIGEIINMGTGAVINTVTYPTNPACKCFASTLSAFSGYGAMLVTERNKNSIPSVIMGSGLVAVECARLTDDGYISVYSQKKLIMELDTYYLKNANAYNALDIVGVNNGSANIGTKMSSVKGRDSLVQKELCGVYDKHTYSISFTECNITDNTVQSGVFTAILPILQLAAKGIDRKNITISKALDFAYGDDASSLLSTLVSLSRAQIELSIRGESSRINYGAEQNAIRLFARGNKTLSFSPSEEFSFEGNGIYVLSPQRKDSPIPDFENTRKLLDYLYATIKKGVVKSAKVFFNTPLEKAVASMENEKMYASTRALDEIICPCVYILVEANAEIGGTHIGEVVAREPAGFDGHIETYFNHNEIRSYNPETLILDFNGKAKNVKVLIKSFSSMGANVKYVEAKPDRPCLDYISSALSDTHILVVCGDDKMIGDAMCDIRLNSALAKYKEEKRLLIAYGEGAVTALSDMQFLPFLSSPVSTVEPEKPEIDLYSKSFPSAFTSKKIAYKARMYGSCAMLEGDAINTVICAKIGDNIYSDGILSSDGTAIGICSMLCDEVIESAIKYYL